jgi:anti-sigma factor ChrR (cupin superfamily)
MSDKDLKDCAIDVALYAWGALDPQKASAVEQRLRSGCGYCLAQAEHYAVVAEQLSLSVTPVEEAPAELRRRLLDRIERDKSSERSERMKIVRRNDGQWVKMPFPGVEIRQLISDRTLIVRMQPDAVFPRHDHPHAEQCYVLEGSITDADGITLHAGDFVAMPGGIRNDPLHSETGCTLFIAYAN